VASWRSRRETPINRLRKIVIVRVER